MTYGHDAVLPMQVVVPSLRMAQQNALSSEDFTQSMMMELEHLDQEQMDAFNRMVVQKKKIAKAYNKKVKKKRFQEDELVWKLVLPAGTKDPVFGKWSPNWEGPFKIQRVLEGNAYWLASLQGEPHKRFINGKYLKKYYPSMWEDTRFLGQDSNT